MTHPSDLHPTYGRKITYLQANNSGFRKFLQHVADGDYWSVSEDFDDGSMFDSPTIQAAKAAAAIVEFDKKVAEIKDQNIDGQVLRMMLEFDFDMKFGTSIRKAPAKPNPQSQQDSPAESDDTPTVQNGPLTGEEKLRQAKEWVKGF